MPIFGTNGGSLKRHCGKATPNMKVAAGRRTDGEIAELADRAMRGVKLSRGETKAVVAWAKKHCPEALS